MKIGISEIPFWVWSIAISKIHTLRFLISPFWVWSIRLTQTKIYSICCRVVVLRQFSGPKDVDVPDLNPNQVLVRARAISSINPLHTRILVPSLLTPSHILEQFVIAL